MPECQSAFLPHGGSICRNVRQKHLIHRGQLSGIGGQLNRNRGSINFGIYSRAGFELLRSKVVLSNTG